MKLVYAVMTLGESRLVTLVRDDAGKLRQISVWWESVNDPFTPPTTWASTAFGEVEFQRSEEANPNPARNV